MSSLKKTLLKKGYHRIPLQFSKSQHLVVKAKINGVQGRFILDTGASNSCVALEAVAFFSMETMDSKTKATGAGSSNMETLLSKDNVIAINTWQVSQWELIVFDLSHVNDALPVFETKKIQGILGADLLSEGAAVIDYAKKWLYLKG
ncbi:MAG: retropepsin-like aspartic protease [Flavicella sp.]|nr:retropepsin-like aspartic protease [Flavicella sp.]